jgi:hypothetical protein
VIFTVVGGLYRLDGPYRLPEQGLLSYKLLTILAAAAAGTLPNVYYGPSGQNSHLFGRIIPSVDPCLLSACNFVRGKCTLQVVSTNRRKIKLIEGNAKCRHLKQLTCKGTLRQVFICLRPSPPYPPSPFILYTCIQYTYSHREGGRGES